MSQAVIECRSVYKIFGDKAKKLLAESQGALDEQLFVEQGCVIGVNDVSFSVQQGEMLVVMGLSGSGKSTLIRCISRLTDTTAGSVLIDGEDIQTMSESQLIRLRRHKMGMVFQNFALLPHKTVLENIAFPLQVKGVSLFDSLARAREMIELVSLHGREESYPRELSGGQQQRVGIARSLAVEPDIWLLDEPFSALDPLIRREMQDEFIRLQSLLNKTIVFITHDFDEALRLADRIAIMYQGKVEQIDTPANIVLNPATDYVRKFTSEVPRERVLTVRSIMESKVPTSGLSELRVGHNQVIEQVAEDVLSQSRPIPVVDDDDQVVGVLNSKAVLHLLFADRGQKKNDPESAPA